MNSSVKQRTRWHKWTIEETTERCNANSYWFMRAMNRDWLRSNERTPSWRNTPLVEVLHYFKSDKDRFETNNDKITKSRKTTPTAVQAAQVLHPSTTRSEWVPLGSCHQSISSTQALRWSWVGLNSRSLPNGPVLFCVCGNQSIVPRAAVTSAAEKMPYSTTLFVTWRTVLQRSIQEITVRSCTFLLAAKKKNSGHI